MSSCSAPSDMAALTELITAATADSTAISSTGIQPPPEAYWPTTSPTAPKPTAAAVRRSRSRRGPDCGARLAASAPVVAKTPAPSTGPGCTPPSTATATASGAGMVTAKRTTSRQGTGGGVVRTSSSSQAGARNPRSATGPELSIPSPCNDPGMTGVVAVRVASAADLQEVPGVEAAADELFRARGVLDLPPAASAAATCGVGCRTGPGV